MSAVPMLPPTDRPPVCRILGTGAALPGNPISNADLIARYQLESDPAWIESRTGIRQRYFVSEGQTTATLATQAGREALQRAGVAPEQVGVILIATCTPDLTFPSTAALVQAELGLPTTALALDLNAACSGFVHALAVVQGLFAAQDELRYALVIGAETFSNLLDFTDRRTCVLFGDGAGAVVLGRNEAATDRGLLTIRTGVNGALADLLHSRCGVARGQQAGQVVMNGAAVYKHAVRQMGDAQQAADLLAHSGHTLNDLTWLVPHQANARIIEAAATALQLPPAQVILTVADHANTSAASIPLALATADRAGKFKPHDLLLLQAFGAGFVWGAATLIW